MAVVRCNMQREYIYYQKGLYIYLPNFAATLIIRRNQLINDDNKMSSPWSVAPLNSKGTMCIVQNA